MAEKTEEKKSKKTDWSKISEILAKKVEEKTKGSNNDLPLTLLKIVIDEDCNLNIQVPFECLNMLFGS